ncbi:hypothetical protein SERLA73DRAFT_189308 [Serpula lacrymans var. lacrymans S7.3]|uniref:Uncharacterized protein n=2 Tax=Serpula lacrymans var. lacrymans TaxID=341189 RepID=F8QDC4_SERL3|nr:uncharacterized protein SERLADRAFT_480057 [Serpula lacrymans var. lacrymans S7.9]EGN93595.1 hypothetical protein SERLA73DRAFT_189308 [Serpula lacrymans var. lacrymans S7.3]EGO18966.1 hypothetical protein SERLADRAFT_480057 [Serpula lacrymans var. lacrymans S7.9]
MSPSTQPLSSPTTSTTSPIDTPTLVDSLSKDLRAHNLARVHAHKTVELSRKKERKERSALFKAAGILMPSRRGTGGGGVKQGRRNFKGRGLDDVDADVDGSMDYTMELAIDASLRSSQNAHSPVSSLSEVSLSSLLSTKRKKASRTKDTEYEVIPRVRPVIVLDEIDESSSDMEPNEPWEHVPRTGEESKDAPWKNGLSYALVLSA